MYDSVGTLQKQEPRDDECSFLVLVSAQVKRGRHLQSIDLGEDRLAPMAERSCWDWQCCGCEGNPWSWSGMSEHCVSTDLLLFLSRCARRVKSPSHSLLVSDLEPFMLLAHGSVLPDSSSYNVAAARSSRSLGPSRQKDTPTESASLDCALISEGLHPPGDD